MTSYYILPTTTLYNIIHYTLCILYSVSLPVLEGTITITSITITLTSILIPIPIPIPRPRLTFMVPFNLSNSN